MLCLQTLAWLAAFAFGGKPPRTVVLPSDWRRGWQGLGALVN